MTGDGQVVKRIVRKGRGEFPVDCPLDDSRVSLHYRWGPGAQGRGGGGGGGGGRWRLEPCVLLARSGAGRLNWQSLHYVQAQARPAAVVNNRA